MKKLLLSITALALIAFASFQVHAWMNVGMVGGGVPAAGGPSCGGTKIIGEDGDLSSSGAVSAGRWVAIRFAAGSTASVGCVKSAIVSCGTATNEDYGVAIYSNAANSAGDDDDMPNTALAYYENASWACATGLQEFILDASESLTSGTLYWIAVFGTNEQISYERDSDGTPANTEVRYTGTGQTYNSRPASGWAAAPDGLYSWSAW